MTDNELYALERVLLRTLVPLLDEAWRTHRRGPYLALAPHDAMGLKLAVRWPEYHPRRVCFSPLGLPLDLFGRYTSLEPDATLFNLITFNRTGGPALVLDYVEALLALAQILCGERPSAPEPSLPALAAEQEARLASLVVLGQLGGGGGSHDR